MIQDGIRMARASTVRNWLVAAAVVCTFLLADLATPLAFKRPHSQATLFTLLGICIGQLNLIATWAALAPGNIVVRLPWSLLLAVFMWYALVAGNRISSTYFGLGDAIQLGLILLFGMLVALVPLWLASRVFHWRLVSWGGANAETHSAHRTQFNLWHLLLSMFLLSVAMAPARLVLPDGEAFPLHLDRQLYFLLAGAAFCNLVVTVPCIWGAFLPRQTLLRVVLGYLFYCGVLTLVEYRFFTLFLGPGGDKEVVLLIYLVNVAQCATVLGTLLVFRACGFQLLRTSHGQQIRNDS